jgi:hypothetical protein
MSRSIEIDKDAFVEAWESGMPRVEMCKRFRVSDATLDVNRKKLGLALRYKVRPRVRLTAEQEETLREMWVDATTTREEIAETLGLTRGQLTTRAKALGLTHRNVAQAEAQADGITRLHAQGLTPRAVASRLGLGERAVVGVLEKRDIEPNTPSKKKAPVAQNYTPSPEELARRLAQHVRSGCARCGADWDGTLEETRAAFREHECAAAA